MKSGIYRIRNLINEKIYIGSAVDFVVRWRVHLHQLRRGIHHSKYLQNSWNKHGKKKFVFEIIEIIEDKTKLLEREQFYLDTLTPYNSEIGYNICRTAGSTLGIIVSEEARLNISKGRKGKLCGKQNPNYGKRGKNSIWLR